MWTEIASPEDFQDLFDRFDAFHDAVMREVYFRNPSYLDEGGVSFGSPDFAQLFFQGGRADLSAVHLLALNLKRLNLGDVGGLRSDVLDEATYLFRDGLIYWASIADWSPEVSGSDEALWFACERLFWRPIEDGLGRRLRLGNLSDYDPELEELISTTQ